MYIFAGNVRVKNTRIHATMLPFGRQFLAYQMDVESNGDAMLLPIPAKSDDILLTACPSNYWGELKTIKLNRMLSNVQHLLGGTLSFSASRGTTIDVQVVGNYDVSIARDVADLANLHPSMKVSQRTLDTLNESIYDGYAIVVAKVRAGQFKSNHPLGISFPTDKDTLYIPLRHEHGGSRSEFDHDVFVSSDASAESVFERYRSTYKIDGVGTGQVSNPAWNLLGMSDGLKYPHVRMNLTGYGTNEDMWF